MLWRAVDGSKVMAILDAELAEQTGIMRNVPTNEAQLRQQLRNGNVQLNGADYVFYFEEANKRLLLQEPTADAVRQLGETDMAAFARFQAAASQDDLDSAYVELEHWLVMGVFDRQLLVCAASMYGWDNSGEEKIADVGILTLPPYRGQGYASRVIRAISRNALGRGYEPQYRCQVDNTASIALAKAAGLTLYGIWEVILPSSIK
jgi:RimJ/RimL family protein N-acetyltransferase